jgi:hypothetical protein
VTKFVWNFAVYCGKTEDSEEVPHVARGEARLAHKVVLDLAAEVQGKILQLKVLNFYLFFGLRFLS